jgi:hypothetical protein
MKVEYTTDQAEGAIPNGERVIKVNSEPGDSNPNGTGGVVIGSIAVPKKAQDTLQRYDVKHGYFIEWDTFPAPVFVVDIKVQHVK